MPVQDDLRRIADQTQVQLKSVHDFFEHSKIVWRSFQVLVDEGHKVTADNLATGTQIDQDGLIQLAPKYTRDYLSTFTFRQFVSTFEIFLFNFLHCLLLHNPWQFSKSQLEFDVVLKAVDRDEIISGVIQKKLNELRYDSLPEWFVVVENTIALGCPTADEIGALAEVKAARDILEHNAGVVNEIYRRKSAKKARYKIGDHIEIDDTYHLDSWRLIQKVVTDVTSAAITRLSKS